MGSNPTARFVSVFTYGFYLSKALSGCVHGLGPCGLGSNPSRETKFLWIVVLLGTSWFAKPIYFEKGNSSILFLSSKFFAPLADVVIAAD